MFNLSGFIYLIGNTPTNGFWFPQLPGCFLPSLRGCTDFRPTFEKGLCQEPKRDIAPKTTLLYKKVYIYIYIKPYIAILADSCGFFDSINWQRGICEPFSSRPFKPFSDWPVSGPAPLECSAASGLPGGFRAHGEYEWQEGARWGARVRMNCAWNEHKWLGSSSR